MLIPTAQASCKEIPNFPGYCANHSGEIFSCHNNRWGYAKTWKPIHPGTNNRQGRKVVCIKGDDGRLHSVHVHRLVLMAFVGPCPEGMEGCHNDGDASNNNLANLRWDTRQANFDDLKKHGKKKGENHPNAIMTDDLIRRIRQRASTGETHQTIADSLGFNRRNISRIVDRSRWSHI